MQRLRSPERSPVQVRWQSRRGNRHDRNRMAGQCRRGPGGFWRMAGYIGSTGRQSFPIRPTQYTRTGATVTLSTVFEVV